MRRLSKPTRELLNELYRPISKHSKSSGLHTEYHRDLMAQIAASGEVAAAARISPFLLEPSLRTQTMAAVRALLETARYKDLLWLHDVRGAVLEYGYSAHSNWAKTSASDVMQLSDVWSLGVMSFHPSGYVREAAVEALKAFHDSASLAFLLIRSNDWFVPLRVNASRAVSERITDEFAEHFARWWPLVLRLGQSTRGDHSRLVNSIRNLLLANVEALLPGLRSDDCFVRRACFDLALRGPEEKWILDAALRDEDLMARRTGTLAVVRSTRDDRFEYLKRLSTDRLVLVRRIAIDAIGRESTPPAKELLLRSALDSSASVRQRAQHYLRRRWEFDVPGFYRAACDESQPAPGAVLGLAETGNPQDAARLALFLAERSPKLRHAAVRGLTAVAPEGYVDDFYSRLTDSSAKVSHAARDAIILSSAPLRTESLENLVERGVPLHAQKNALRLLVQTPGWGALAPLLRSLARSDPLLRDFGLTLLARWPPPPFRAPSQRQASEITAALRTLYSFSTPKCLLNIESELWRHLHPM